MKELIFIRTEQKSASFSQGRAFPERGHKGDKRAIRRDENQRHQAEDHQEEAEEVSADLQTYPEYKDSGLPWLGSIPRHWDCLPHRAIFEEIKEQGHVNEPLLSVTIGRGILRQEELLAESSKKDSSNLDKSKYKFVEPGDIAYNKMRAWQGAVGVSRYRGAMSITLPDYEMQKAIAEAIELDTVEIDKAIIHAKQEINLIREYRTRLISDVVTGKVDVRHLAPQPGGEDLEEMVEALEPLGDEPGETDEESMDGEVEP
jgi:hypothetical protein